MRNGCPTAYRWGELAQAGGLEQLDYYQAPAARPRQPKAKDDCPRHLHRCADQAAQADQPEGPHRRIDKLDWFSAREEGLGNLYEGLAGKERRRQEIGRGAVFHAASFDRLHRPPDEAAGRRDRAGPGGGHRRVSRRRRPIHQGPHRRSLQTARRRKPSSSGTTRSSGSSWSRIRIASA